MADLNKHTDRLLEFIDQKMNNEFQVTAPEELWQGIAEQLPPQQPSELSFDQQLQDKMGTFKAPAPAQLWENILGEMDAPTADDLLDDKVRQAYQVGTKAPEQIWYQIDHKLSIDQIWRDMTPQLNQLRKKYIWRKRFRQLSVAAVFLLLLHTCIFQIPEPAPRQLARESTRAPITMPKNTLGPVTLFPLQQILFSLKQDKEISTTKDQNQLPLTTTNNTTAEGQPMADANTSMTTSLSDEEKVSTNAGRLAVILPDLIAQNTVSSNHSNNSTIRQLTNRPPIHLSAITAQAVTVQEVFPFLPTTANKKRSPFRSSTQVGIIASVQQSQITNDGNYKTIQRITSEVEIKAPQAFSYGLNIEHVFAPKQGVSAELWLNAQHRQRYNFDYRGKPIYKDLTLNYSKLALAYRLNFLSYGLFQQHKLLIKPGAYLSHLNSKQEEYSSGGIKITSPAFNTWNAGIKFSLAQQHAFRSKVVLEYGLRSEVGIRNLTQTNPRSNNTNAASSNLINWGLYGALRYQF